MNMTCKVLGALMLCIMSASVAEANVFQNIKDLNWEDGRLRIEGQVLMGTRSGRRSRTDDRSVVGTIEKEFALGHNLTVGLRAIPLFYYDEEITDTEMWAVGGGASIRYYTQEAMDGWFVEYYESLIGQSEKLRGNSGSLNLMSEVGVGYEFDNNWHVTAKWRHLSNAGLAHRNSGINGIGIAVGFSF